LADNNGGGLYYTSSGNVLLTSVTISNNRADNNNSAPGTGGGIDAAGSGTFTLRNTIVFGNFVGSDPSTTPDDIQGSVDTSIASSYNLIGTGGSGGLTNLANNNQVGVADARLGPLASNGGPTQTHALLTS